MAMTNGAAGDQFGRITAALSDVTNKATALPDGDSRDQLRRLAQDLVDAFTGRAPIEPAVGRLRQRVWTLKAARQTRLRRDLTPVLIDLEPVLRDLEPVLIDQLDVSIEQNLVPELRCVGFDV
ncbi:MAG TPA: hypothetical protein VFX12_07235 [Vicinamibacterales bacterium]|nr:hypothetical protein [Vicinamibacterales bacterium]